VGRAQPCQGWGREFESRLSLSCLGGGTGRHAGLKILFPLRECGFDSRPRYFKPLITHCYSRVFLFTGCKKGVKDNTKTEGDKYLWIILKVWGVMFLRIQFHHSVKEKCCIPYTPKHASKTLKFRIERFCVCIRTSVVEVMYDLGMVSSDRPCDTFE